MDDVDDEQLIAQRMYAVLCWVFIMTYLLPGYGGIPNRIGTFEIQNTTLVSFNDLTQYGISSNYIPIIILIFSSLVALFFYATRYDSEYYFPFIAHTRASPSFCNVRYLLIKRLEKTCFHLQFLFKKILYYYF